MGDWSDVDPEWKDVPTLTSKQSDADWFKQQSPAGNVNLNAPGGMGQGIAEMLNPVPAIKNVANAMFGNSATQAQAKANLHDATVGATQRQWQLTKEAANAGRYSEMVGHGLAAALPVIGPAAAQAGETIGGVQDMPPNLTMPSEGPQQAPQVARGIGQGIGLLAPSIASGAVNAVRDTRIGQGAAGVLDDSATRNYARILGPTTKANKAITERVAPELAARGTFAATRKGLRDTAAEQLQGFGQRIGDAFDNLPPGTSQPLQPILDSIDNAAQNSFTLPTSAGPKPKGPLAQTGLSNIDDLKNSLAQFAETDPTTGQQVVPIEKLRAMRQYFDGVAADAGRYQGTTLSDQSLAQAHGMAADAIRNELAQQYPDIDKLNKEYSFWKNVHKVVNDTVQRTQSQSAPLSEQLATTGAAVAKIGAKGSLGSVALTATGAKALIKLIRSPAWQTTSAITKSALADMVASGNSSGVANLAGRLAGNPLTYRIPETMSQSWNLSSLAPLRKKAPAASPTVDAQGNPILTSPENP